MSAHPTNAWPALLAKAGRKVQTAQGRLQAAQARQQTLSQTRDRLRLMMKEYAEGHKAQELQAHTASDNMNYRMFLGQLQQLLDRATAEVHHAEGEVELARRALQHWELEHLKLVRLVENMQKNTRLAAHRAEQKRLDDLAVAQHRLRHSF